MQAYDEYLSKSISAGKEYEELPSRIQAILTYNEWCSKVKEAYISKGLAWGGLLKSSCPEEDYYAALLKKYRDWMRLFPYHLSEYIQRVQRTSAFRYYSDVLANMLKEDKAYDRLPNFTAADILQCLGIGRNEVREAPFMHQSNLPPSDHLILMSHAVHRDAQPGKGAQAHVATEPQGSG
jgi:hypothetical protein